MIYGITLDSLDDMHAITAALSALPARPWLRVVFDENIKPDFYQPRLATLRPYVAGVMGELLDSFYVKKLGQEGYMSRARSYYQTLGKLVDVWEIGNEVNGDWLGKNAAPKFIEAQKYFHGEGARTALTLYMDEEETWEPFATKLPQLMRSSLDWVLMSDYPEDNNNHQANWPRTIERMAALFPSAQLGIGECGTESKKRKAPEFARYYGGLGITHARFMGGFFWWYGAQDMVPRTAPLWQPLAARLMPAPAPNIAPGL